MDCDSGVLEPTLAKPELTCDAASALTASIRAQGESFFDALQRASRQPGAKRVHVLRITLRQLLSTLELAAVVVAGVSARLRHRLAALLRRLSRLRDVQVQRREVARWALLLNADTRRFSARLRRRQRGLAAKVRGRLDTFDAKAVRQELGVAMVALGSVPTSAASRASIRAAVRGRLARLHLRVELQCRDLPHESDQPRALHRLRVALKRYRYSMNAALPILCPRARELLSTTARLQEALGSAHDADILAATVHSEMQAHASGGSLEELYRTLERKRDEARLAATTALREARLDWPLP